MTNTITKVEYAPLYRDGIQYAMDVFGPYADGEYDVEVYVDTDKEPMGTYTLSRNTHVIADMFDNVAECIAMWRKREGI